MPRKPKFKPKITRIKLNPEQAVLSCSCDNNGHGHNVRGSDLPLTWYMYLCVYRQSGGHTHMSSCTSAHGHYAGSYDGGVSSS